MWSLLVYILVYFTNYSFVTAVNKDGQIVQQVIKKASNLRRRINNFIVRAPVIHILYCISRVCNYIYTHNTVLSNSSIITGVVESGHVLELGHLQERIIFEKVRIGLMIKLRILQHTVLHKSIVYKITYISVIQYLSKYYSMFRELYTCSC